MDTGPKHDGRHAEGMRYSDRIEIRTSNPAVKPDALGSLNLFYQDKLIPVQGREFNGLAGFFGQFLHQGSSDGTELDFILNPVAKIEQLHSQTIKAPLARPVHNAPVAQCVQYSDQGLPRNGEFCQNLRKRHCIFAARQKCDDVKCPVYGGSVVGFMLRHKKVLYMDLMKTYVVFYSDAPGCQGEIPTELKFRSVKIVTCKRQHENSRKKRHRRNSSQLSYAASIRKNAEPKISKERRNSTMGTSNGVYLGNEIVRGNEWEAISKKVEAAGKARNREVEKFKRLKGEIKGMLESIL